MKNVTITVEDSVLEWARIEAARRGTSVSRMLGDFMAEMMQREDAYERAYLAWRTDERSWRPGVLDAPENIARGSGCTRTNGQKDSKSGATP
jgi:hypothetical protein